MLGSFDLLNSIHRDLGITESSTSRWSNYYLALVVDGVIKMLSSLVLLCTCYYFNFRARKSHLCLPFLVQAVVKSFIKLLLSLECTSQPLPTSLSLQLMKSLCISNILYIVNQGIVYKQWHPDDLTDSSTPDALLAEQTFNTNEITP